MSPILETTSTSKSSLLQFIVLHLIFQWVGFSSFISAPLWDSLVFVSTLLNYHFSQTLKIFPWNIPLKFTACSSLIPMSSVMAGSVIAHLSLYFFRVLFQRVSCHTLSTPFLTRLLVLLWNSSLLTHRGETTGNADSAIVTDQKARLGWKDDLNAEDKTGSIRAFVIHG